jgi:hypothetical protein
MWSWLSYLQVTSRYPKAPNAAFGSSARFKANYMTF